MKAKYEKLQALLDKEGITAYRLAKNIGKGNSALSSWKNGYLEPGTKYIAAIAKYFGVTPKYFYCETEEDEVGWGGTREQH